MPISAFLAAFPVIGSYYFVFTAEQPLRLPTYTGSTWRGLLGHGLKRTVCVTRLADCRHCLLLTGCAYPNFFDLSLLSHIDKTRFLAHPYVLVPDATQPELITGETFGVGLRLFGQKANQQLPYLIHALSQIQRSGIGSKRSKASLSSVWQWSDQRWQLIFSQDQLQQLPVTSPPLAPATETPTQLSVRLETPLRIKQQGRFVCADQLTGNEFIRHLLWRLNDVAQRYSQSPSRLEIALLEEQFSTLDCQLTQMQWYDWTRYSNRQQSQMQFGGLLGELCFRGEQSLAMLWPLLQLGQWTHLGKTTVMGLGCYRLLQSTLQPPTTVPDLD